VWLDKSNPAVLKPFQYLSWEYLDYRHESSYPVYGKSLRVDVMKDITPSEEKTHVERD
jgi:hypothetical protein